jgi:formate hydrogenlyase subunit 3/multisubunit Na+/H+ antiporter MnhD subunit
LLLTYFEKTIFILLKKYKSIYCKNIILYFLNTPLFMLALGFIYGAFGSHLCYIVAEKQQRAANTHTFWLLIIGLLAAAGADQIGAFQ